MYCEKCGQEITSGQTTCPNCGTPVAPPPKSVQPPQNSTTPPKKTTLSQQFQNVLGKMDTELSKSSPKTRFGFIVTCICIVSFIVMLICSEEFHVDNGFTDLIALIGGLSGFCLIIIGLPYAAILFSDDETNFGCSLVMVFLFLSPLVAVGTAIYFIVRFFKEKNEYDKSQENKNNENE